MSTTKLPTRTDRMPLQSRKPRAGPLLEVREAIATSLNGVSWKWWRDHPKQPPLSETSEPVIAVEQGLRFAGYKIVPMERADYE